MISKGEALSEPRASLSPGFPSRVLVIYPPVALRLPAAASFCRRAAAARIPKEGGMIYPLIFF